MVALIRQYIYFAQAKIVDAVYIADHATSVFKQNLNHEDGLTQSVYITVFATE